MRILTIADAPAKHTQRWVEAWCARHHEVHVASFRSLAFSRVTMHRLSSWGLGKGGYILALSRLRRLYKQLRPDVVHAQYVTSYGFLAAAAGMHPLVVTAWGTDVLVSPWRSPLHRVLAQYALKNADAITTVAEHMNASVVSLGIPVERVQAMPFGVDVNLFAFRNRDFTRLTRPWHIVCSRDFEPIYDVASLIEACALLRDRGVDFKLTLISDGSQANKLRALVKNRHMSDLTTFTGYIEHDRLTELLADADIYVSPAHSDGNNVCLNEAMAVGCFPIATDIPANAQWITHGENGYLYSPGNVEMLFRMLMTAIENPELMQNAIIMNRRIVEERANWQRSVERMESLFYSLAEHA